MKYDEKKYNIVKISQLNLQRFISKWYCKKITNGCYMVRDITSEELDNKINLPR